MKALSPSREQYFPLRWIRGIRAIRRRACVSRRRGISGSWACDALAPQIEGRTRSNSLKWLEGPSEGREEGGRLMRSADFASCESEPPIGGCSLSFVLICRCDMGIGWCLSCQYHTPKWRGRRGRVRIIKYFIKLSSNALSGVLPRG